MAKNKAHIQSSKDFQKVIKEGNKRGSPHFVLYSRITTKPQERSRLGLSISSRNIPLATRRNRIKRVIREKWRKRNKLCASARDLVLVVKKGTDRLKNEKIIAEFSNILDKHLS